MRRICNLYLALGFLFLAAPVLFLDRQLLAGISCSLGLMFFICDARCLQTRGDALRMILVLWLAYSIRFCRVFGSEPGLCAAVFLIMLPFSFVISVALLGGRALQNLIPVVFPLTAPILYTLIMSVLSALHIGFIADLSVYSMCIPVYGQNLSWASITGMSFFYMLLLSCVSAAIIWKNKRGRLTAGGFSIVLVLGLLISGSVLTSKAKEPDYTLKVAVATAQENDFMGNDASYSTEEQITAFRKALETAAAEGAELLVLHEEYFFLDATSETDPLYQIPAIIRQYGIPVLIGYAYTTEPYGNDGVNRTLFFDGNGTLINSYTKYNLVPLIEAPFYARSDGVPESFTASVGGHDVRLCTMICFDLNNNSYVHDVPADTELLIAPSWDWDMCNLEQIRTWTRSVDINTTVLKHTFDGFTYVSGPYGLTGELLDLRGKYEEVHLLEVPIWEKD